MPASLTAPIPEWGGRRAADALDRVRTLGRRRRTPCILCGQSIDYSIPSTEADGCTVQHIKSRKLFPHLTWDPSNWAPAHRSCNSSAGAGESPNTAGVTSQAW